MSGRARPPRCAQLARDARAEGEALARELRGRLDELAPTRAQMPRPGGLPGQLARRLAERIAARRRGRRSPTADRTRGRAARRRADITEELVGSQPPRPGARAGRPAAGPPAAGSTSWSQEIGRELNTIGTSRTAAEISSAIVGGQGDAREAPRAGPERGMMRAVASATAASWSSCRRPPGPARPR